MQEYKVTVDDGTTLAYRTVGEGERDVLLVHGWMVSGAIYGALIAALDVAGLRLIVPDLRGTGGSARPQTGYTLARHAADVLAVAAAAGTRRFVVVGHSMGGQIAQWIAATAPDKVAGLVLLCPVPACGMPLPADAQALFRNCGGQRELQQTILGLACKELSDAARERLLADSVKVAPECIAEGFDAWSGGGFEERLAAISAPTLCVGTDDPFLPPAFLRETVTGKIRGARLALLKGPGHYVQVERPLETAALLEAFLAGGR